MDEEGRPEAGRDAPRALDRRRSGLLVSAALAVIVLGALGAWFFRYSEAEVRRTQAHWLARLRSLAEDRRATVEDHLAEGAAEARLLASFPSFLSVEEAVRPPPSAWVPRALEQHVAEIANKLLSAKTYQSVHVVAADGRPLVSVTAGQETHAADPALAAVLGRARSGVAFAQAGERCLVLFGAEIGDDPKDGAARAAVVIAADAEAVLFRRLSSEPVPTETGETLLVRREGDTLRFLSRLRHSPSQTGTLTLPATTKGLAAAAAFQGTGGEGVFRDYRGVEVLAVSLPLERYGVAIVAKIDRDEAMAEAHHNIAGVGLAGAPS